MLVRLIKWDYPALRRQTPGGTFQWKDITFTEDNVETCDHVVVLNHAETNVDVVCSPDRVWAIAGEPPTEHRLDLHRGLPIYSRIYMQDPDRHGARYVHSHGALPWRVDRSYDELLAMTPPDKPLTASWITSNTPQMQGHRDRLAFLERLRASGAPVDLFGRGIRPIDDKWDALAPYRYSLAIENFSNPFYWTEKIVDPLLAWTMPIYFGCTEIERWLPEGSFIRIDIHDPDAPERVKEIVASDRWFEQRDAIAEARRRILNEHQLFPFLHREIHAFLGQQGGGLRPPRRLHFDAFPDLRPGLAPAVRRAAASAARPLADTWLARAARRLWPRT